MDYRDAIDEVLDKAANIKLAGHKLDVVTLTRRQFAERGCCDSKYIDAIEKTLRECLRQWTREQRREIWQSTDAGAGSELDFDWDALSSIDMHLEGELMYELIEELSPDEGAGEIDGDIA